MFGCLSDSDNEDQESRPHNEVWKKKILHNYIKLAAMWQRKARASDEIPCFVNIQFQRKRERERGWFRGLVVGIVADFREKFSVNICFFVDFGILLSRAVDKPQKRFGKARVKFFQTIFPFIRALRNCRGRANFRAIISLNLSVEFQFFLQPPRFKTRTI